MESVLAAEIERRNVRGLRFCVHQQAPCWPSVSAVQRRSLSSPSHRTYTTRPRSSHIHTTKVELGWLPVLLLPILRTMNEEEAEGTDIRNENVHTSSSLPPPLCPLFCWYPDCVCLGALLFRYILAQIRKRNAKTLTSLDDTYQIQSTVLSLQGSDFI